MIPVIDLFAGPGGLGEGFSAYRRDFGQRVFKICLSIEKDPRAHRTLLIRSFYRQFPDGEAPDDYYDLLRGKIGPEELFARYPKAAAQAHGEAWNAELGNLKTFPMVVVDRRIKDAIGTHGKWILVGGPPCQAYSVVGRVRMKGADPRKFERDPRHFLYREYLRILADHRPSAFVMENVKGILSAEVAGKSIIDLIVSDFEALDYTLYSFVAPTGGADGVNPNAFVIRSEEYGLPQARHRVILLGVRNDLKGKPKLLQPSQHKISLWDAIGDLPPIRSGLSRTQDSTANWIKAIQDFTRRGGPLMKVDDPALRARIRSAARKLDDTLTVGGEFVKANCAPTFAGSWFSDSRLEGVCNHSARYHIAEDLHRYLFAACFAREFRRSPILADFPKRMLPEHKNVDRGVEEGMFKDRFRVQQRHLPATTVTAHISKDGHYFIHPDPGQCRSLTVREAARLQTFPDNYFFSGPRTSQYQQVGNAVPPLLARHLAAVIHGLFDRRQNGNANGSPDDKEAQLEHVPDPVPQHWT